MSSVLVVEDDLDIAAMLRIVLTRAGYQVFPAADGRSALRAFHQRHTDLVVLDIGLPEIDGWEVLTRIRDVSDVPVLLLSAHGAEADKVRGLRGGADDYLTKPFSARELVARVQALLRRTAGAEPATGAAAGAELGTGPYDDGLVRLDPQSRQVRVAQRPVTLTPTEFRLLAILVRNPGQVLGTNQLLARVWDDPTGLAPDRVKYAVRRLRRKVGWDTAGATPLESVRGVGYRYRPP